MLNTHEIENLEKRGFKRWKKNGMDRLYVNATALGLNYTCYKTGNIMSAEFNGETISNSEARRMKEAKTYIDLNVGKVYSDNPRLHAAVGKILFDVVMGSDMAEEEDDHEYTSAENGDYSPNCPWKAPGMSIHDFI